MKNKNKMNQASQSSEQTTEREDAIELQGVVDEALPGTLFSVIVEGGNKVLATLSGKLRINRIRLIPGDRVTVAVSPYDTSRGRVLWRLLT